MLGTWGGTLLTAIINNILRVGTAEQSERLGYPPGHRIDNNGVTYYSTFYFFISFFFCAYSGKREEHNILSTIGDFDTGCTGNAQCHLSAASALAHAIYRFRSNGTLFYVLCFFFFKFNYSFRFATAVSDSLPLSNK